MYNEHPVFAAPPDETVIWRYTTWGRLCDVLVKNALFFVRATAFDDPWEASHPESHFDPEEAPKRWAHLTAYSPKTIADLQNRELEMVRRHEEQRRTLAVNCWHIATEESDSHWRIYGRSDEGIAIRSTVGRLKAAVDIYKDRAVNIGEVKYIDFAKETFPTNNGFWPVVYKRLAFRHDKELRAVVWEMEPGPPFGDKGVYVVVDVTALIQEVVVTPLAAPSFLEPVREMVRRFGLSCEVKRSDLLDPPRYRVPPGSGV